MAEPGWYEDPHGGGGQRWWDGAQWTEHTSPPPQAAPSPGSVPPPPGSTGTPAQAVTHPPAAEPAAQGSYGSGVGAGTATVAGSTTPAGSSGGGSGKMIGLVVGGIVLLVVLAVVVTLLLRGSDDSAAAGEISTGDSVEYVVEESGSFDLDFDIPEGLVVIDVRGNDGFDPVATLVDPDTGEEIARNDDRSSDHLARYGGDRLDSLLELELPAGSYRLVVTGFAQQGGPGVVNFPVVGG